jgi:hypothetical protein
VETNELDGVNRLMPKRLKTHFENKMPQGIIVCQQLIRHGVLGALRHPIDNFLSI